MRKIVAGLFMSLDGVVESPQSWHFPYMNDEMGAAVAETMASSDTMLLGRRTYEEFASFWPTQGSDEPFADQLNQATKYVVSSTLRNPTWQNTTVISDNVAEQVAALKDRPGSDITISGSPTLVRSLLRDNLLDELGLMIHPIVVGQGARLFDDGIGRVGLKLADSTTFSTGVLSLTYQPA
jgi:dihydrofolate reductase